MTTQVNYPQQDFIDRWPLRLSPHSTKRASQRGLSEENILDAMSFGRIFHRQGLIFYVVGLRGFPKGFSHEMAEKLNNMVVVTDSDGEVVTCYKSSKGFRHIKHKTKKLY